ncbi:RDD family protein [Streptomyces drozdowiczii]|uniref:RDD family protein n=1 Tax=Streptomyces drozdowiczii TaxID=202862 RepID=A0ABY6PUT9_9ACTN|nr:RDD family protein [Streptomyces drozdowiczii]MCX0244097.1 RDD family protein [Streptomyces drozdowiczii]UZK56079.1 RDD family protein [Streptomyces drozdowiczii]
MSAPTPAPGDESPGEGYYPDPSIPGYVRYWNGASWVPGTSRPAPAQAEPAVVEETGPVFLDEEGQEDGRPEPAIAWQADASHQSGFAGDRDRVSWPEAPDAPAPEEARPPAQRVPSSSAGRAGLPEPARTQQPVQARPALEDGTGTPDPAEGTLTLRTRPAPVTPWTPPANDPFGDLARTQGRPAPLGKRFLARLIDTVVLGALTAAAAVPLAGRAVDHIDGKIDAARQTGETVTVWLLDSTTAALGGALLGVFLLLGVLLDAVPTAKWGRTLGKKLCGIDVRDIESHETPGFGAALRRWLVYGVPGLLVVGIAGVLWCLVDRPWRQCWHDKAARTFVAG